MLMALWTTVTFVSLDNPAAFVTFNVTQFVPSASPVLISLVSRVVGVSCSITN
jgi:hypothetical protein